MIKVEIVIRDGTISYILHPETTEDRAQIDLVGQASTAKVSKNGVVTFTVEQSKTSIGKADVVTLRTPDKPVVKAQKAEEQP